LIGTASRRGDRSACESRSLLATCWMAWRVGVHLLSGAAQITLLFPRLSRHQCDLRVQAWARGMLNRLGIEMELVGAPPRNGPTLLVSNHVSWVDIMALHAVCHCRFVAKADVAHWPLFGTLASGGGTLYVRRESRRDAMRVVQRMAEALRDGDILAVFPEGTTGDGSSVLPFHSSLIQAAIAANAPVQPVAVTIVDGWSGRPSRAVRYMADDSLGGSLWRTLRARELRVRVAFGAPQLDDGRKRRRLADDLRREIIAMR
jgi:1-acyl-sn-glycerol-3-phosphate acyltransferase